MIVLNRLLVCLFLATASALGHSQPLTRISIKLAASSDVQSRRTRVLANGDLIATGANAVSLMADGYDVPGNPSDRLPQLQPWVYGERYDIRARASPSLSRRGLTNDPQSVRPVFRQVLADKFGLVMRTEIKTVAVYVLLAVGAPKLTQSAASGCVFDTAPDGCHAFAVTFGHPLNAKAINMDDLALYIGNWTDLLVVNKTKLSGLYKVSTSGWRPMQLPPPPPGGNSNVDFSQLSSLDSVLLRLGLKLEKAEAAIPFYTVEHIERPILNR